MVKDKKQEQKQQTTEQSSNANTNNSAKTNSETNNVQQPLVSPLLKIGFGVVVANIIYHYFFLMIHKLNGISRMQIIANVFIVSILVVLDFFSKEYRRKENLSMNKKFFILIASSALSLAVIILYTKNIINFIN